MTPRTELVDALVTAISAYDADALRVLCTPDARHWFSGTEREQSIGEMAAMIGVEARVVADASFDVRRIPTATGVVLQMTVDGTTRQGASFRIPVCLVVTYDGDRIARFDEYAALDRAKGLLREMNALLTEPATP